MARSHHFDFSWHNSSRAFHSSGQRSSKLVRTKEYTIITMEELLKQKKIESLKELYVYIISSSSTLDRNCQPLGMGSGAILNSQLTASSEYDLSHGPHRARLNSDVHPGSWSTLVVDVNQWLQVDFLQNVTLSKVATQGRHIYPQWVLSYLLSYSMDGSTFENYKQCGGDKVSLQTRYVSPVRMNNKRQENNCPCIVAYMPPPPHLHLREVLP